MNDELESTDVLFFQPIDITKDNDEILIKKIISLMEFHLDEFRDSARLCSKEGRRIVFVYEMRGHDLGGIRNRLALLIDAMKHKTILSIQERQLVQKLADRSNDFEHASNDLQEIKKQFVIECQFEEIGNLIQKEMEREQRIHDKKECLCFCN